jgi:glutaredoxin-related protein
MEGFIKDCPIDKKKQMTGRKRLHGAGIKSLGFIERTFKIANICPQYAPSYLNITLLNGKLREMENMTALKNVLNQFMKFAETACLFKSDDCYQNALIYYKGLSHAALRANTPGAESMFAELKTFFNRNKKKPAPSENYDFMKNLP